jgi:hypothetical protein
MAQWNEQASRGNFLMGAILVIAGLGAMVAKLRVPELYIAHLRSAAQILWPLLLIGAGIVWWIGYREHIASDVQSKCARAPWEARDGQ